LLTVFLGIILLGIAAGYWETGGGGHHRRESALLDLPPVALLETAERNGELWLL
jgi:hypothetical protein